MPFTVAQKTAADRLNDWHQLVVKPANEALPTSTALQLDDHLVLPVQAGGVYRVHLVAFYDSPVAAGLQVDFALPAGATFGPQRHTAGGSGSAFQHVVGVSPVAAMSGIAGTATAAPLEIWGVLTVASTAGNAHFRWAQNAASGTTTVLAGSFLELFRRV